jgi:hypothetical protein
VLRQSHVCRATISHDNTRTEWFVVRTQPAIRWNWSIRYVRFALCTELESTAGIACKSRRRGRQVAIIESRPANLLASAIVPCAWLSPTEPKVS